MSLFEPMPLQQAFLHCKARQRLIRGGNRTSKTTAAIVNLAQVVTGRDPLNRCPKQNGIAYVVAKDEKAIGEVIWKKLGRAQCFKMIRDEITNEWRAFRPMNPMDQERKHLAKWAPPLIPPRMIASKGITWISRKSGIPKVVRLVNGWEIHFFSSKGEPPQGTSIDYCMFSEEIVRRDWYPELSARLLDRSGYFTWDATPQAGTEQLWSLHVRAQKLIDDGVPEENRGIVEFLFPLSENIHVSAAQKKEFEEQLGDDEEEVDVRIHGEFQMKSSLVYPEWSNRLHIVEYRQIPAHWTRYVAIDPGHQFCAAIFAAVPPPQEGDGDLWFYDELFIKGCNAKMFGKEMRDKCSGQGFYAFIIDYTDARKHEAGSGLTIIDQYSSALEYYGVRSQVTGFGFAPGDSNAKAGEEGFRAYLREKPDGTAPLKVFAEKCPNFIKEIKHFRKKKMDGEIKDKAVKRRDHAMDCARYLAQYGMYWHPARGGQIRVRGVQDCIRMWKRLSGEHARDGIMLG